MEEQLPLLEKGTLCGEIRCRSDGFRTSFSIDVPAWSAGVKKVWLTGADGRQLLLGTLLPERGRMHLAKTLSHTALRAAGVEHPISGEINPGENDSPWQSLRTFTCPDPVVREAVGRLSQGGWRTERDQVVIRFPWRLDMPVPVTALFCLSQVRDGMWYIYLPKFDAAT